MVRKLKAEAWVDYISFSYDIYTYIISNSPKAKVAYLNGDVAPEKLKADGFFGSDYHFSVFKNNKWIETSKILDLTKKDYPIRTIGATMLAVRDGEIMKNNRQAKYTSARMATRKKFDWKYGRLEVRAMLPKGRGIWPATWMLPTDWKYGNWPKSGEIDVMEQVGYNPDSVHGTVHTFAFNHTKGTQVGEALTVEDPYTAYHVYAIEWYETHIDFFIDEKRYFTFQNSKKGFEDWSFDQNFHLLLNVAVGGNWGGKNGVDDSIFPAAMKVDYVRMFQKE